MMAWAEIRGNDRGLRGPSAFWLAVWVVTVAYRYLRKWTQPETTVVREVLRPGERLVITNFELGAEPPVPPTGRGRRRRRAAAG